MYVCNLKLTEGQEAVLVRLDLDINKMVCSYLLTDSNGDVHPFTLGLDGHDSETYQELAEYACILYLLQCKDRGWAGTVELVHGANGLIGLDVMMQRYNFYCRCEKPEWMPWQ